MATSKRIIIEGMHCAHCTSRVQKALSQIEGITTAVDLAGADASVPQGVSDAMLTEKIEALGFRVVEIKGA